MNIENYCCRTLYRCTFSLLFIIVVSSCSISAAKHPSPPKHTPISDEKLERAAKRMIRASEGALAPVYAPLAEHIIAAFDLSEKEGIGIDIGGGPGVLVLEMCKRTSMHWINADINPFFFPYLYRQAEKAGLAQRISAVPADAVRLPFRTNYADVIVSRGSLQFWGDREQAFTEIRRVLKPGGRAFIGRGFPPNLPAETAKQVRLNQGGGPSYDAEALAAELGAIMDECGITDFKVFRPSPEGAGDVNYGVWVEFSTPEAD